LDVPEDILGQLGLKVQHALRAYTPKDQQVIKSVAGTFRANSKIDTETVIQELKTGEALVSVLNKDGSPAPVERILIRPPESQIGPITQEQRDEFLKRSPFHGRYDAEIDRESAYEMLKQKAVKQQQEKLEAQQTKLEKKEASAGSRQRQTITEALLKNAARSIGTTVGRQIVRGIMGSLLGRR
jgi:uncharacterized protein